MVEIPIAGSMAIEIDAGSAEDALAAAWAVYGESGSEQFEVEWIALDRITTDHVCHAPLNEQCAHSTHASSFTTTKQWQSEPRFIGYSCAWCSGPHMGLDCPQRAPRHG